ncbi:cyclic lactone autoinducer peptide, partial [Staphylococcus arlettae]
MNLLNAFFSFFAKFFELIGTV